MTVGNVAFIQHNSLYMKGIVGVLKEELTEHTYRLYDYQKLVNHQLKIDPSTQLLLLEYRVDTNFEELINQYKNRDIKVAIWTFSEIKRSQLLELMKAGVDGYIYGDLTLSEFRTAINQMLKGHKYIHPYFSSLILNEYARITHTANHRPHDLLTKREWEILEGIVKGFQNEQIANQLHISDKTVKNHVSSILKKLNAKDRTNAVIIAIKNNWIHV